MQKFVALFDLHWGYERKSGHKVPLHDERALNVALEFMKDFQPHHTILGGDMLDCASISHHNDGKPGKVEGLRLVEDAEKLRSCLIEPVQHMTKDRLVYLIGNHEVWLQDLIDKIPALDGILNIQPLLHLGKRWEIVEEGGVAKVGKLNFIHGDMIKGTNCALNAVVDYEANVRFGHFHTFQVATKSTPVMDNGHTGIAVPCLCKKGPGYGGKKPNKWVQGFLWGYVGEDGTFSDYVTIIVNGRAVINGRSYKG